MGLTSLSLSEREEDIGSAFVTHDRGTHVPATAASQGRSGPSPLLLATAGLDSLVKDVGAKKDRVCDLSAHTDSEGRFRIPSMGSPPVINRRYQLVKMIGSGTCSNVFLAKDLFRTSSGWSTPVLVAVKILHIGFESVGLAEADVLSQFRNQEPRTCFHVVRVLDSFPLPPISTRATMAGAAPPRHFCVVMERLEPVTWHSVGNTKDENGEVEPVQTIDMHRIAMALQQLLAALAALHEVDVTHADVKADNVLQVVSETKEAGVPRVIKLIDLSNALYGRKDRQMFDREDADFDFDVQTLPYRAPEVVVGLALSPKMDLWSLGCLAIEWVTGAVLFSPNGSHRRLLSDMMRIVGGLTTMTTPTPASPHQQHSMWGGQAGGVKVERGYQSGRFYNRFFTADGALIPDEQVAPMPAPQHRRVGRIKILPHSHRKRNLAKLLVDRGAPEAAMDPQFTDLLARLLDPNLATRVTAREAMLHPFFYSTSPLYYAALHKSLRPVAPKTSSHSHTPPPFASPHLPAPTTPTPLYTQHIKASQQPASPFSFDLVPPPAPSPSPTKSTPHQSPMAFEPHAYFSGGLQSPSHLTSTAVPPAMASHLTSTKSHSSPYTQPPPPTPELPSSFDAFDAVVAMGSGRLATPPPPSPTSGLLQFSARASPGNPQPSDSPVPDLPDITSSRNRNPARSASPSTAAGKRTRPPRQWEADANPPASTPSNSRPRKRPHPSVPLPDAPLSEPAAARATASAVESGKAGSPKHAGSEIMHTKSPDPSDDKHESDTAAGSNISNNISINISVGNEELDDLASDIQNAVLMMMERRSAKLPNQDEDEDLVLL